MHTLHTIAIEIAVVNRYFQGHNTAMAATRTSQEIRVPLSFRVPLSQLEEIEEAVRKEVRKHRTDLLEVVWEWAWKEYKRSGSLRGLLQGARARRYSSRRRLSGCRRRHSKRPLIASSALNWQRAASGSRPI